MRGQHKCYHWSITVYTVLSLDILSYDVIICEGTFIIFLLKINETAELKIYNFQMNLDKFKAFFFGGGGQGLFTLVYGHKDSCTTLNLVIE